MRFLKKILLAVYIFVGAFAVAALVIFAITGNEPTALITCCFSVAGVESLLSALIKTAEEKAQNSTNIKKEGSSDGNII